MTTWEQTAIIFIFSSVILSGVVQVINLMGPTPIVDVEDSVLAYALITENDIDVLSGKTKAPLPLLGDTVPSDVLGFLAPVIFAVGLIFKILFTVFGSWALVLFAIADAGNIDHRFLAPIIPAILIMVALAFLVVLRAFKETVPFQ